MELKLGVGEDEVFIDKDGIKILEEVGDVPTMTTLSKKELKMNGDKVILNGSGLKVRMNADDRIGETYVSNRGVWITDNFGRLHHFNNKVFSMFDGKNELNEDGLLISDYTTISPSAAFITSESVSIEDATGNPLTRMDKRGLTVKGELLDESGIKKVKNLVNPTTNVNNPAKMVVYTDGSKEYKLQPILKETGLPYNAKSDKLELTNGVIKTEVRNDEVKIYDVENVTTEWSSMKKDSLTVNGSTIRKDHILTLQNLNALGDIGASSDSKMVVYNSNGRFYKTNVPNELTMPDYTKSERIEMSKTKANVLYRGEMDDEGVRFEVGPYATSDWFSFGSNGIAIGKGRSDPNPLRFTKTDFEKLKPMIKASELDKRDYDTPSKYKYSGGAHDPGVNDPGGTVAGFIRDGTGTE